MTTGACTDPITGARPSGDSEIWPRRWFRSHRLIRPFLRDGSAVVLPRCHWTQRVEFFRSPAKSLTPPVCFGSPGNPSPNWRVFRKCLVHGIAADAVRIALNGQLEIRVGENDSGYFGQLFSRFGRSVYLPVSNSTSDRFTTRPRAVSRVVRMALNCCSNLARSSSRSSTACWSC